jgi:hypothetical protein
VNVVDGFAISRVLNLLPFVRWDRFVEVDDDGVVVYGWIGRDDGRADFIELTFCPDWRRRGVQSTTSSEKYSDTISKLLHGEAATHVPCQRVEDVFGEFVDNKVVLVGPDGATA